MRPAAPGPVSPSTMDALAQLAGPHPSDELLSAVLEGRATPAELDVLDAHLDGCEECARLLAAVVPPREGCDPALTRTLAGPTPESGEATGLEPDAPQPGDRLGRYIVLEVIGAGGMGVVYAAHDPELDRKVALKLLRVADSFAVRPSVALRKEHGRLLREARALARLSHPNVVPVHDVGTHEGHVYLAMELVAGETLRAWIRRASPSWREIVRAFRAAGRGLAAAHAAGIVHRDFKPENVLVGRDGSIKVADFGVARADEEDAQAERRPVPGTTPITTKQTTIGRIVGTPAYMSPEQFLGERADPRSDQFSFAVALWEALHGERPFAGRDALSLLAGVEGGRVRPAPKGSPVPARIRTALRRALAADPEKRWPALDELLAELARDPAASARRVATAVLGASGLVALGFLGWQALRPGAVVLHASYRGEPVALSSAIVSDVALAIDGANADGDVPPGVHAVVVEAEGFEPLVQRIEVRRGHTHELELELSPRRGSIDLEVRPGGATVWVDGEDHGGRLRAASLPIGEHEIVVRREGFHDVRLNWTAQAERADTRVVHLAEAVAWTRPYASLTFPPIWIGDPDHDGRDALVYRSSNTVIAHDPWTDRELWSGELSIANPGQVSTCAGDVDGDGVLEIGFATPVQATIAEIGVLGMPGADGGPRRFSRRRTHATGRVPRLPLSTCPDIDGDGAADLIVGGFGSGGVTALRGRNGAPLWERAIDGDDVWVAIASDPGQRGAGAFALSSTELVRLDADGRVLFRAEVEGDRGAEATRATIADARGHWSNLGLGWHGTARLDGDDALDLVAMHARDGEPAFELRAYSGADGRVLWRVVVHQPTPVGTPASIADVDGDGRDDVLVGGHLWPGEPTPWWGVIDGASGRPKWRVDEEGSSAGLLRVGGELVAWRHVDGALQLRDAATGTLRATVAVEGGAHANAVVADWNGDGREEIVIASAARGLQAHDPSGGLVGSALTGRKVHTISAVGDHDGDGLHEVTADAHGPLVVRAASTRWTQHSDEGLRTAPVVADLDADGTIEVAVIGAFPAFGDGTALHVFDAVTGALEHRTPSALLMRPPVLVPAAGGGHDVVAATYGGPTEQLLVRWSGRDGRELARSAIPSVYAGVGVAQLDDDPGLEVLVTGWSTPDGGIVARDDDLSTPLWTSPDHGGGWLRPQVVAQPGGGRVVTAFRDGTLVAVDATDGREHWSVDLGVALRGDLTIADLYREGEPVIVARARKGETEALDVVVLAPEDGQELERFAGAGSIGGNVVVADLDGDGRRELLTQTGAGITRALRPGGETMWTYDAHADGPPHRSGAPLVLDADPRDPVLLVSVRDGSLRALDPRTGAHRWHVRLPVEYVEGPPVRIDVDGDGRKETIFAGGDGSLQCLVARG